MTRFVLNEKKSEYINPAPYIFKGLLRYMEGVNRNMLDGNLHVHDQAWTLGCGFMDALEYLGYMVDTDYKSCFVTRIHIYNKEDNYYYELEEEE